MVRSSAVPVPRPQMLRDHPHIRSNTVLYIEQRPKAPFRYETLIKDAYDQLSQLAGNPVPDDLPAPFLTDPALRRTIEIGLARGYFRDTTLVTGWLDRISRNFRRRGGDALPPLQLKVVHAETDIDLLTCMMIEKGHRPAGVFLSGSPKMIPETITTDPAVMQTAAVCAHLLEHNIPLLGICFGLQLLGYVKWGAMVEWLTNPPNMQLRVLQETPQRICNAITPGARQSNFGAYQIEQSNSVHPMLQSAVPLYGLKSHSTYFPFPHPLIPADAVLATSARHFLSGSNASTDAEVTERIIEVLQFGAVAFGTQLHPEFTPALLLAMTYLPAIERSLRQERHHVEFIREQLRPLSEDAPWSGDRAPHNRRLCEGDDWSLQRIGYNFTQNYIAPQYLERKNPKTEFRSWDG